MNRLGFAIRTVGEEREEGGAGDADALGVVAAEGVGVEDRGDGEGVVQPAEGVEAGRDVVLEEGEEEVFAGLLVRGRVFVVGVVAVAVVAVVVAEEALEGAVGRDEEGVVVRGAAEKLLDVVVLVDQRGKLGRVVARLDQLVDGLVRGRVVVSSVRRVVRRVLRRMVWRVLRWVVRRMGLVRMIGLVRRMGVVRRIGLVRWMGLVRRMGVVLVLVLLAGLNQGGPAVERALDALGDAVFERREEAVGIRAASPPGLDGIMVRSLRVALDQRYVLLSELVRGNERGSGSREQEDSVPHCCSWDRHRVRSIQHNKRFNDSFNSSWISPRQRDSSLRETTSHNPSLMSCPSQRLYMTACAPAKWGEDAGTRGQCSPSTASSQAHGTTDWSTTPRLCQSCQHFLLDGIRAIDQLKCVTVFSLADWASHPISGVRRRRCAPGGHWHRRAELNLGRAPSLRHTTASSSLELSG